MWQLPEPTQEPLNYIPDWDGSIPDEYCIYTDGSLPKDPQLASWGLVIFARVNQQLQLVGTMCQLLSCSGNVCASAKGSSTTFELAAIMWALLWALSHAHDVPIYN